MAEKRATPAVSGDLARGSDISHEDVQATFCAVLVDTWVNQGVTAAFIAPGSRSTPLTLALMADDRVHIDVFHDERSAAFAALGFGVATGRPAVAVCTSGTAAAHFHAAVIEADLSGVPLLVCTADRPPELRDVGAPQTIDQVKLFGAAVRWFHDPGVPSGATAETWPSMAARSVAATSGVNPGPVHLNLPFREPLVGRIDSRLSAANDRRGNDLVHVSGRPVLSEEDVRHLERRLGSGRRGVIVAGRGCGDPHVVAALARAWQWPVIADSRSRCQGSDLSVVHADALLRIPEFVSCVRPEVVLRLGESPSSKVLNQWIASLAADECHVSARPDVFDPQHRVALHITADPTDLCRRLSAQRSRSSPEVHDHVERWLGADRVARAVLAESDDEALPDGPAVARALVAGLPAGTQLVLSSSMPIRDLEWFAGDCSHLVVHANRGANGIDGVVASGVGVARGSGAPTVVLIGDVALIHDASTMMSLGSLDADLRIVVVDNDGGGIFHHLPQAAIVGPEVFEKVYGTPHGVDLVAMSLAAGLPAETVARRNDLHRLVRSRGPRLIRVATDRVADVAAHRRYQERIAAAVRAL